MEHAQIMMLVDADADRKHYTALDRNISDVLNRQDIDDSIKLKLYQMRSTSFWSVDKLSKTSFSESTSGRTINHKYDKKLLEVCLLSIERKRHVSLTTPQAYTFTRWDDFGQIRVYDGRPVESSIIGDIVSHRIKAKKSKASIGCDLFAQYAPHPKDRSRTSCQRKKEIDWLPYWNGCLI